jgi:hypothetical protein
LRRTKFTIGKKLVEQARRIGNHKTAKEAITAALQEYIRFSRQWRILDDFGAVDFDPTYNYKAERRRKRMG